MRTEDHKTRRQRFTDEAARRLAGHQYSRLTPLGCPAEVWRCQQPGTSNFAFDISITRYGITVAGDIDGMIFSVGSAYGLPFLAGNDVEYYIHSKLESQCQLKEYDAEGVDLRRADAVIDRISAYNEDEGLDSDDDGFIAAPARGDLDPERYRHALQDFCATIANASDDDKRELFGDLAEFLNGDFDDAADAFAAFRDNEELLRISDTWEYDYERPQVSLIARLYMVRHAAREILNIKHPAPGSALAECGSLGEEA